jgi:hypothetical protein
MSVLIQPGMAQLKAPRCNLIEEPAMIVSIKFEGIELSLSPARASALLTQSRLLTELHAVLLS